jgi:diacylglycerol kinase family enzyme
LEPIAVRVLVLFNPIAGAGRARSASAALAAQLEGAGHIPALLESRRGADSTWLQEALEAPTDLVVVVGGDGAVRLACDAVARKCIPLWQSPLGTENLFARQWGMRRGAKSLLAAMDRWRVSTCDVALANGEPFMLMASMGFDAEVVHDLASRRRGGISHLSYLAPILRTVATFELQHLEVHVDGVRLDGGGTGFVVIANARQYALRVDPVPHAEPADELLDVSWFPARSIVGVSAWSIGCRLRRQHRNGRLRRGRGREVLVECHSRFRYQLDGDPPALVEAAKGVLRVSAGIAKHRLRVLCGGAGA